MRVLVLISLKQVANPFFISFLMMGIFGRLALVVGERGGKKWDITTREKQAELKTHLILWEITGFVAEELNFQFKRKKQNCHLVICFLLHHMLQKEWCFTLL